MVEQSDRAPLLDWEEIPPPDPNQAAQPPPEPQRDEGTAAAGKTSHPSGRRTPTCIASGTGWSRSSCTVTSTNPITAVPTAVTYSPSRNITAVVVSRDKPSGCGFGRPEPVGTDRSYPFPGITARDQWEEKDQIVAVFVVTFDTRSGLHVLKQEDIDSYLFAGEDPNSGVSDLYNPKSQPWLQCSLLVSTIGN
ncbi:hypothetical protein XENOCAPTIV_023655 [Xenoophorus captivus]|uniref:Uncharacterized protein n=1 Tax=Xenoophorus captivus TaxID=1517983 RepID=A0ABV0RB37_9TELE